MSIRSLFLTLLMLFSIHGSVSAQVLDQVYENKKCHFSFHYPSTYRVVEIDRDNRATNHQKAGVDRTACVVSLVSALPSGAADTSEDAPEINVSEHRGLLTALHEAGFDWVKDHWVVGGRMGAKSDAQPFVSSGMSGIKGTAELGCYGDKGYAGVCEVDRLVAVSDGDVLRDRTLIIDGNDLDFVLKNFQFHDER